MSKCYGATPERGTGFQRQKGTFLVHEFREHSLKVLSESVDNYLFFSFYGKFEKKRRFIFLRKKEEKFAKTEGSPPMNFCRAFWERIFRCSKMTFLRGKKNNNL